MRNRLNFAPCYPEPEEYQVLEPVPGGTVVHKMQRDLVPVAFRFDEVTLQDQIENNLPLSLVKTTVLGTDIQNSVARLQSEFQQAQKKIEQEKLVDHDLLKLVRHICRAVSMPNHVAIGNRLTHLKTSISRRRAESNCIIDL